MTKRNFTEEHRKKLSEAAKRRRHSKQTRDKISESMKKNGSNFEGKIHSQETINKMKAHHISNETRMKMSIAHTKEPEPLDPIKDDYLAPVYIFDDDDMLRNF